MLQDCNRTGAMKRFAEIFGDAKLRGQPGLVVRLGSAGITVCCTAGFSWDNGLLYGWGQLG